MEPITKIVSSEFLLFHWPILLICALHASAPFLLAAGMRIDGVRCNLGSIPSAKYSRMTAILAILQPASRTVTQVVSHAEVPALVTMQATFAGNMLGYWRFGDKSSWRLRLARLDTYTLLGAGISNDLSVDAFEFLRRTVFDYQRFLIPSSYCLQYSILEIHRQR